jgi:choline transporter-like protein 2/4/5
MVILGFMALGYINSPYIEKGNPLRLLRGVDYKGFVCGVDTEVINYNNKWEPASTGVYTDSNGNSIEENLSICVSSCPSAGEIAEKSPSYSDTYGDFTAEISTKNVLFYCISTEYNGYVGDVTVNLFADFLRTIYVIAVAGFAFPCILSLMSILMIRIRLVLRALVWTSIVLVFALLVALSVLFLDRASTSNGFLAALPSSFRINPSENPLEIKILKVLGALLAVSAFLWICVICFMRERIALAIGLIRESSKAITSMILICFFPFLQTICFLAFTAIWTVFFFYLASSGNIVTNSNGIKTISYDHNSRHALIFLVFGFLWNVAYLDAVGQMIAAHAGTFVFTFLFLSLFPFLFLFLFRFFSILFYSIPNISFIIIWLFLIVLVWYFSNARKSIGSGQVLRSLLIVCRYHLGTAAFGSLIIAFLRSLRIVLEYVKLKQRGQTNCIVEYALCCLSCCLWCFDRCIKFINKHAYIQCALYGSAFCTSASNAYSLIVVNLGQVAAVTVVGDFVVMIIKISISLTCAAAAYIYMVYYMGTELKGIALPSVVVAFAAFFTATMFLSVVSSVSNTVMHAYITDEQTNKGKLNKSHENNASLRLVIEEHRKNSGPLQDNLNGDAAYNALTPQRRQEGQTHFMPPAPTSQKKNAFRSSI